MYLSPNLVNCHKGKVIGVLGSGPTLNKFKDEINDLCDIVIACNGSVNVLDPKKHYVDYFLWYDSVCSKREWFDKSDNFYRSNNKNVFSRFLNNNRTIRLEPEVNEYFKDDIESYYYSVRELSSKSDFKLKFGGRIVHNFCTVNGLATQFAYHMGASQINLFGCGFDNDSGQNYAYTPKSKEVGSTCEFQKVAMDRVISKIKQKRIEVISYGKTRLSVPQINI